MSGLTPYGNTSKKVQRYIEQCIIMWIESGLNKIFLYFRRTLLFIKRSKNFFYFFWKDHILLEDQRTF